MIRIEVRGVRKDEGTIVILEGVEIDHVDPDSDETIGGAGDPGRPVLVAADHRMAQHIIAAMAEHGPVIAMAESWQVWPDYRGRP